MDDGGARQRSLLSSLKDIKVQLYDTEMELRQVERNKRGYGTESLQVAARQLGESLQSFNFDEEDALNDTSMLMSDSFNVVPAKTYVRQGSGESTYSDDHFESDDDSFHRESMENMKNMSMDPDTSALSAIGKSMVQMGLDDSMDSLRLSVEMANSSSQLVHLTAEPNGVLDRGEGKTVPRNTNTTRNRNNNTNDRFQGRRK